MIAEFRRRTDMCSLGLTKTGQGARIEQFYRSVPSFTVPGAFLSRYEQGLNCAY